MALNETLSNWRGRERRTVLSSVAVVAILLLPLASLFVTPEQRARDMRSVPGTTWLSGEREGQVVLAVAGGDRPSVAVDVADGPTELDVLDVGGTAVVHDREAGELVTVDGQDGTERGRTPLEVAGAAGDEPIVVPAGEGVAYIVEPVERRARTVWPDGTIGAAIDLPGAADGWVGTDDGVLWVLDVGAGMLLSAEDGEPVVRRRLRDAGPDLSLSAVGDQPVVLDHGAGVLHWPRRTSSTTVPDPDGALLQQPSSDAGCVAVATPRRLSCLDPAGEVAAIELDGRPLGDGALLFATPHNAAIAHQARAELLVADWELGRVAELERPEPSDRRPRSSSIGGALLVDDPGSAFAVTVQRNELTPLDKSSSQQIDVRGDDGAASDEAGGDDPGDGSGGDGATDRRDVADPPSGPNQPPRPVDDRIVTRSGRQTPINVLANDADPDGDPLVIVAVGDLPDGRGTVTVVGGAALLYQSPPEFEGTFEFDYTVSDPSGMTARARVQVIVLDHDQNSPPVPGDDDAEVRAGRGVDIDVLANDRDPESDPLRVSAVSTPSVGTATVIDGRLVRYEAPPANEGTVTFTYTIVDGYGGEATATVGVRVRPPSEDNQPPRAEDDVASVIAGRRVEVPVLDNDRDPDGDPLRVVHAGVQPGVEVTIVEDQRLSVLADPALAGVVELSYTIEDPGGLRATAQLSLLVEPPEVNRPPVAVDDHFVTASVPVTIDLLDNDIDPDGDPLVLVGHGQPATGGRVEQVSVRAVRVVPDPGHVGPIQFRYQVADPSGVTATGRVTVDVAPPAGSGPVARDDSVTVFPGEAAVVDLLANDSHPDGLPIALAGPPVSRGGSLTVDGTVVRYQPPSPDPGVHVISYTIQDVHLRTATARLVVTVVPRPVVDRPPIAASDVFSTPYETSTVLDVLANDHDPDGQPLAITGVGGQPRGQVSVSAGSLRYSPPAGFSGIDSFTYRIRDAAGGQAEASVAVHVGERPRRAPVVVDDAVTVIAGGTASLDPTRNDVDPDGDRLVVTAVGRSDGVSAQVGSDGRTVTIRAGSMPGTFNLSYTVEDPDGLSASGVITVLVQEAPNQPPVAVDDRATTPVDTAVLIPVLANDDDPDGGTIRVLDHSQPADGTATVVGSAIRFTPGPGFGGVATFTYRVVDDQGEVSRPAVVRVTVEDRCPVPAPVLFNDSAFTRFGQPVEIDLFGNDPSAIGTLTLGGPDRGSVTVLDPSAGLVRYTPPSDLNGRASFTYRVENECGEAASATVTVTVNRAPVARDDVAESDGRPIEIDVLANDSDPDGDDLRVVEVFNVVGGTASISGNRVRFVPDDAAVRGALRYAVADEGGLESRAIVRISIERDPPPTTEPPSTTEPPPTTAPPPPTTEPPPPTTEPPPPTTEPPPPTTEPPPPTTEPPPPTTEPPPPTTEPPSTTEPPPPTTEPPSTTEPPTVPDPPVSPPPVPPPGGPPQEPDDE